MTLSQRLEQAHTQAEAAISLLDESAQLQAGITVRKANLTGDMQPQIKKLLQAHIDKMERNLRLCLAQFDSLITTMSEELLSGTVTSVRVYQMMEERL